MTGRIGFVFPGQGSQSLGMMADLADEFPQVRATFDEASAALGRDLWMLSRQGPEAVLNRTVNTQPVMLAADIATWRVWQDLGGPEPALGAGHSLGEYAALVAAGSLEFAEAVRLVEARGRLMQEAVPEGEGAMAAVLGLQDDRVEQACREAAQGRVVEPVNFNAPGQVVIAGHADAVARAMERAEALGARKTIRLPVSVPSHCSLMRPAAERFAEHLAGVAIRPPAFPVLHNADLATHTSPEGIREALVRQLYRPVRWVATIEAMKAAGVQALVECGPGKVLTGLNRRIDRRFPVWPLADPESLDAARAALAGS